jgi:hypothetical protein
MNHAERSRFVNTYATCFGYVEKQITQDIVDMYCNDDADEELIYDKYGAQATSVLDALLLWNNAVCYILNEVAV